MEVGPRKEYSSAGEKLIYIEGVKSSFLPQLGEEDVRCSGGTACQVEIAGAGAWLGQDKYLLP